jgi:acyl-coenzyme A thioesterase PaaI-like protein
MGASSRPSRTAPSAWPSGRNSKPGLTHRTAQLNVHFLAKGEGDRIVGRGRALHLGTRMGYGEGEVLDGDGRLLARATATFIVLPAPGAF